MTIQPHYPLKKHNTFGFEVSADYFAAPTSVDELRELLSDNRYQSLPRLIIGGGSNLLFCDNFHGLVIQPKLMSIEKIAEDNEMVFVRAGAGVVWDDLVAYAVNNGWGGIENLSYIPGHVGAAPVQNIGAYGAEAKDVIHQVECLTITGETKTFSNADCKFAYRDSAFKNDWKDQLIVTHVVFRLHKNPVLQTHYGNVEEELKNYPAVTLTTLRQAVIAIRRKKLPDPKELGNAGSFFKNPVVPKQLAEALVNQDPKMSTYPVDEYSVKLPAGRLIELAGWKGRRVGNVGVHAQQALVLVNYGNGTGQDILALAAAIQESVYAQFAVRLSLEVNCVC